MVRIPSWNVDPTHMHTFFCKWCGWMWRQCACWRLIGCPRVNPVRNHPVYNLHATFPCLLLQVVRLDVASARTRYSEWIGGNLPTFVPFARAARGRKAAKKGSGGSGSGSSRQGGGGGDARQPEHDADHIVRLRRLRYSFLGRSRAMWQFCD